MSVFVAQTSFTAGELSPRLKARVDVQKYFNGCRTLENFMIFPHGGITRRPGTEFIYEAYSDSKTSRLVPFQFNTEQVYCLELSDYIVRFFKDGGIIWAPETTAVAGTTSGSATFTVQVDHTSGGVLHILQFKTTGWWTVEVGTTSGGNDIHESNGGYSAGWHTQEFTPPTGNTTMYLTFTMYSGEISDISFLSDEAVSLPTLYEYSTLSVLNYTQSADTMFLTHRDYQVCKLTRRGHHSWDYLSVEYGPSIDAPSNLAVSFVGTITTAKTWSYVVTTVTEGVESEPCAAVSISSEADLDNSNYNNLTWDAVDGADRYNVYRNWNGVYYYIGEAYNLTSPTLADNGVTPDKSSTPPSHYDYFDSENNYPGIVTFFEQRLLLASTYNKPQTVYMSNTADFLNFDKSIPTNDDDRCVFTMDDDEVNNICWVMPGQHLYIGTSSGEYYMSSTDGASAITPSDVMCRRTTRYGSAEVRPVMVGETVLFACRGANKLREMSYKYTTDNYTISMVAPDVTIMAEHLFRDYTIKEIALAQNPDPYIYVVRSDGELCVLAYMKEQEVVGWSRIVTDGEFESVCCLHGDDYDEVWCVVKRTINGSTKRYVERFGGPYLSDDPMSAFFVDCGVTYSSSAAITTISGLDWLEGKTVQILADGAIQPDCVVTNGAITLQTAAYVVTVGLGFTSTMVPVMPEISTQQGTSQGRIIRINRVTLRVHQSSGIKIGKDSESLYEPILRDSTMALGQYPDLFTGDLPIDFGGRYARELELEVVVNTPVPATILGMFSEASLFER